MKALFTIIILFILIIIFNNSYSQIASTTVACNDKNIYYQALTQYISFERAQRGLSLDTIFIEDDHCITDSLLSKSAHAIFVKLKPEEISDFIKTRKGIIVYKVVPLRFENGEFSVSFVPSFFSYDKKKHNTNKVIYGSYRVVYRFENSKFVFQRVEDHFS